MTMGNICRNNPPLAAVVAEYAYTTPHNPYPGATIIVNQTNNVGVSRKRTNYTPSRPQFGPSSAARKAVSIARQEIQVE